MVPLLRRLAWALAALVLIAPASLGAAAEPPPPSDAEITRFIAVEDGLVADPGRAQIVCAETEKANAGDSAQSSDPAVIGRRLDANPTIGPVLRRHGLSGQRYTELAVHFAAALIGLAMADDADATARQKGKPAGNRDALLARSAAARVVAARQQELVASLENFQAVCEGDTSDDEGDDSEE